jgi:hypothetical protein
METIFYNMGLMIPYTSNRSGDMGMKLREEHTHFFSDHGCGMYNEPFRPLLQFIAY